MLQITPGRNRCVLVLGQRDQAVVGAILHSLDLAAGCRLRGTLVGLADFIDKVEGLGVVDDGCAVDADEGHTLVSWGLGLFLGEVPCALTGSGALAQGIPVQTLLLRARLKPLLSKGHVHAALREAFGEGGHESLVEALDKGGVFVWGGGVFIAGVDHHSFAFWWAVLAFSPVDSPVAHRIPPLHKLELQNVTEGLVCRPDAFWRQREEPDARGSQSLLERLKLHLLRSLREGGYDGCKGHRC